MRFPSPYGFLFACLPLSALVAPLTVHLVSNLASPQPVGTPIGIVPQAENAKRGKYVLRYSVSENGGPFHIVRDFTQSDTLIWNAALYEHAARIRVELRNSETKETATAELPFQFVSRIKGSQAVITPTANPVVALFSAPACEPGSQFRVAFRRAEDTTAASYTSAQPCRSSLSNNVYVAGMRADMAYQMRSEISKDGAMEAGPWLPFHTGLLEGSLSPISIPLTRSDSHNPSEPVIISAMPPPWHVLAADQQGNVVWYLRNPTFLTRVLPHGHFLVFDDGDNSVNDMKRLQVLREIDLAGQTLRETNIGRVAEQLQSRGIESSCKTGSKECVPGFHHDAIRLPNGHTLVLTGLERIFPSNNGDGKKPRDILGDLIIDLDEEFQVSWMWNSFDYLDVKRVALSKEKCKGGPGADGCTPVFLADEAEGWLHSNSLNYLPESGDLLLSIPEQDWVIKLDYKDGKGSGKIIWRLGPEGDFTAKSDDPAPWFSYQHDVRFEPGTSNLLLIDDGPRRKAKNPQAHSRGQVWKIDEQSKTATLIYNADLGTYSIAVGSAQALPDGNYSFEAGFINPGPSLYSRAIETSPDGKPVYAQQLPGLTYRSFRVTDLYSSPVK